MTVAVTLARADQLSAQVTLDQLLSAPLPSDLTASPFDNKVAWVSNERGVRNIVIADRRPNGALSAAVLTHYSEDNGYELDHLTWGANGTTLVYTGGGSLEGGGPVNPVSRASGSIVKEIIAQRMDGSPAKNFGPGEAPEASPMDGRIAFIRGGQIWTFDLSNDNAPVQLIHDRGNSSDVKWSPDARKIAFLSRRPAGNGLLGIYNFASASITWMSPGIDNDIAPQWSADSKRVAWVRRPASELKASLGFRSDRAGPPWSIWVGDATSGAAKSVWRADPGPGSIFRAVEDGTKLLWSTDDRLIFPWEKTGWIRLYSISATGDAPQALTPDRSEIFAARLNPTGSAIIFSSNATDDDHRHLWEVASAGGVPRMLSRGASIEDLPAIARNGSVYALHSTGRDSLTPVLLDDRDTISPIYQTKESRGFPGAALVEPQRVVFRSSDKMEVHGQLFMPRDKGQVRRPAILFFHGGPQRQMLLGWHPMGAYTHLYAMNQRLASEGYIVLSVNFRGGTGYGLDWREPLNFAEAGGSEIDDISGAVAYLKSRSDVDPARVGVYGMSYGGVMTSLALSKLPTAFAAGVDIAGVHNWKSFLPYLTAPGSDPRMAEIAFNSSAVSSAKSWRAPVLLIQGDDDRAVNFSQTTELVDALRNAGHVEPELFIIPDEVHDFILHRSWLHVFERADKFFDKNLPVK